MKNIIISFAVENGFASKWHKVTGKYPAKFTHTKTLVAPTIPTLAKNATKEQRSEWVRNKRRLEKEFEDAFKHFNDYYFAYNENGEFVEEQVEIHEAKLTSSRNNALRIAEIQPRLNALSQDLVQVLAGEVVPDLEERKAEFISLHNELRELKGLPPRETTDE